MSPQQIGSIARELLQAHDRAERMASIAARHPDFEISGLPLQNLTIKYTD